MMKNKERAILFSIYMRILCEPSKFPESAKSVSSIRDKLRLGEMKYYKQNKVRYEELLEASKTIWHKLIDDFHDRIMVHELAMSELWSEEEEVFKSYFKLKDTKLVKLYRQYCDVNSIDDEQSTFELVKELIERTDKEFGWQ
jgi:hypothetical protein